MRGDVEYFGEMGLDVYWKILGGMLTDQSPLWGSWGVQAEGLVRELGARDGIEKLMVDQILWMHARLGLLSVAASQRRGDEALGFHSACDRAADTLRRHIAAFLSYRYPERKRFFSVKRANIAQQQIVVEGKKKRGRPRKKNLAQKDEGGGCGVVIGRAVSEAEEATVLPEPGGIGEEEGVHSAASDLGEDKGAADVLGEEKE
jgi:hypothetical protein